MENSGETPNYNPNDSYSNNVSEATQKNRRVLIIGIFAAVVLVLVISLVAFFLFGPQKRTNQSSKAAVSLENAQLKAAELDVRIDEAKVSEKNFREAVDNYQKAPKP